MKEQRYTATRIAEILGDALEVQEADKESVHHRVRYLAKKEYLRNGQKIDKRGTLDFPASEVFRAAILCEFLAMSMDVKVALTGMREAEALRFPPGEYPASTKTPGGWSFSGGLSQAIRGVESGEEWLLLFELRRSGEVGGGGPVAKYVLADEDQPDVNDIYGRTKAATVLTVNLKSLFTPILCGL